MMTKASEGVQLLAVELLPVQVVSVEVLAVQVVSVQLVPSKIVKKNWTLGCLRVRMFVYPRLRPVNYRICGQHHCSQ